MRSCGWKGVLRVAAFLALFIAGNRLQAQTGTANIQGTVKDATGAVIPGANVTATQSLTARQFRTTTNEVGFYLIPSVQNGLYRLTVDAKGMETWKGELTLQVGETAVVDANLKVGGTAT